MSYMYVHSYKKWIWQRYPQDHSWPLQDTRYIIFVPELACVSPHAYLGPLFVSLFVYARTFFVFLCSFEIIKHQPHCSVLSGPKALRSSLFIIQSELSEHHENMLSIRFLKWLSKHFALKWVVTLISESWSCEIQYMNYYSWDTTICILHFLYC